MPRRSRDAGREVAPIKELDRREVAGAVADLGVLVPIVVALILVNGLSASAVLLPAGLLYVAAGWFYRLPIPVQPLKAFGAIAIAQGLGADVIAAGSLLMALVFIPLGLSGLLDRAAAIFPKPLVRGVQLSVGILLIRLAWGLVVEPPRQFADAGAPTALLVAGALVAGAAAYVWRARGITVVLVGIALVWVVARAHLPMTLGPSELRLHTPSASDFATAAVVLVVPQLPLTFANSCIATADAARGYFGAAASRVTAGRLAVSLGLGNVLAGLLGGMPVCHGAPIFLGTILVVLALVAGQVTGGALAGFPVWILAALLGVAGVLHIQLLRDLRGRTEWGFAIAAGVLGALVNLAVALAVGLFAWWVAAALRRSRARG